MPDDLGDEVPTTMRAATFPVKTILAEIRRTASRSRNRKYLCRLTPFHRHRSRPILSTRAAVRDRSTRYLGTSSIPPSGRAALAHCEAAGT